MQPHVHVYRHYLTFATVLSNPLLADRDDWSLSEDALAAFDGIKVTGLKPCDAANCPGFMGANLLLSFFPPPAPMLAEPPPKKLLRPAGLVLLSSSGEYPCCSASSWV